MFGAGKWNSKNRDFSGLTQGQRCESAVHILLELWLQLVTTGKPTPHLLLSCRISVLCEILFWWSQCYDRGLVDGCQPSAFSSARVILDITVPPLSQPTPLPRLTAFFSCHTCIFLGGGFFRCLRRAISSLGSWEFLCCDVSESKILLSLTLINQRLRGGNKVEV